MGNYIDIGNVLSEGQDLEGVLRATRELLSDPAHWTQAAVARDAEGRIVKPTSPEAQCWCLEGALARSCNRYGLSPPALLKYLDALVETELGLDGHVLNWANDFALNHEDVLAFLDRAIELAGAEG